MIENSTAQMRLCPHCANSIAEDATDCRYCKTDFSSQFAPRWLKRDEPSSEPRIGSDNPRDPQSLQNLSGWAPCSWWL